MIKSYQPFPVFSFSRLPQIMLMFPLLEKWFQNNFDSFKNKIVVWISSNICFTLFLSANINEMIFLFSLIKIPRLNLIRVRRKVSDFLSGLHRARAGKQFATSHLFLTQRENYIRVACSAIIILDTKYCFIYTTSRKFRHPFQDFSLCI